MHICVHFELNEAMSIIPSEGVNFYAKEQPLF